MHKVTSTRERSDPRRTPKPSARTPRPEPKKTSQSVPQHPPIGGTLNPPWRRTNTFFRKTFRKLFRETFRDLPGTFRDSVFLKSWPDHTKIRQLISPKNTCKTHQLNSPANASPEGVSKGGCRGVNAPRQGERLFGPLV